MKLLRCYIICKSASYIPGKTMMIKNVFLFLLLAGTFFPANAAEKNSGGMELRYKNILLRDFRSVKSGQVVNFNIGTAAHGPGTLAVLKKYLPPEVKITVWADAPLAPELAKMMRNRFPEVPIVHGKLSSNPPPELLKAVDQADLFLVSSGASIAGSVRHSLEAFQKRTGKPAAAYAIGCTPTLIPWLDRLDFVWLRDPVAAEIARSSSCPLQGWAPDAVFDFDAADAAAAAEFLRKNNLRPGGFICCIPGNRNTPRWEYFNTPFRADQDAENRRFVESDNAPLVEIIRLAVQKYKLKVLICPEQITEIALIRPQVYDKLPPEIRKYCVPMDSMWSPDLALGVYRASRGVFGVEMHSQVMAAGNGVPGVLLRHPRFGSKSEMWKSVGLQEWLIHTDLPDYTAKAVAAADKILGDPEWSAAKLRRARNIIDKANQEAIRKSFRIKSGK